MKRQLCCENGHYYDSKYEKCPLCVSDVKTQIISNFGDVNSMEKTMVFANDMKQEKKALQEEIIEEDELTLAGWLVIISEEGKGRSYKITFGFNSIGRAKSNDIAISNVDSSISATKHSSIVYDYDNNKFILKHEDGKLLTYVNKEMILDTKELHNRDRIKIGNIEFIFIALCDENFSWNS